MKASQETLSYYSANYISRLAPGKKKRRVLSSFASLRVNKDKPKGTWKPLKSEIVEIEDTKKRDELIDRILNLPEDNTKGWAVTMRDWVLLYEEVPEEEREAYSTGIGIIYSGLISLVEVSNPYAEARRSVAETFKERKAALSRSFDKEDFIKKWPTSLRAERDYLEQKIPSIKKEVILKYMHNYLSSR
ncbi:hypothetical protein N9C83_02030 [Opitutales bacterium]|nr:hypothetical protein [Opitutales bacterium]